jgi:transglutaminase-like putative cysteine protease
MSHRNTASPRNTSRNLRTTSRIRDRNVWRAGAVREAGSFMRTIALTIALVYTGNVVSPGAQAFAREVAHQREVSAQAADEQANFGKALLEAKEHLRVVAGRLDATGRRPSVEARRNSKEALRRWRDRLGQLDRQTQTEFDATARLLREKHLPQVILQRHADAVAKYQRELTGFRADLEGAINTADDATARAKAESALNRLNRQALGRSPQRFDPHQLPNTILRKDSTRRPRTTSKEFLAAGLTDNPRVRLASINPFDISHFPSASDPAYLAATTEVTLTPDIVAKASELNGNPVNIYNWVHNNVQWEPTWGAIQDASQTLASRRGNAFDIASLTIALLRASGIPARYVHGTLELPADQFRNWVGGFHNINAALDYASAGGIPITAITSGGQIVKIQMEHIWVEAAVDFIPSRGAINKSADSWAALDPSFQQVQFVPGLDALQITGVNPQQLVSTFVATGSVNQAEGWATGFDPTGLQATQTQGQTTLQNYIQTNLPNATVGDVLGAREIVQQSAPVLSASLPYHLVTIGARYGTLPAALEQQITFALGEDIDGTPLSPQTFAWPALNNQQVTLSFRPASQADQDALTALLPNTPLSDVSQLPATIPAYLVNVIPELKLNDTVLMSGPAMPLGQDLTLVFNPTFVSSGVQDFSYNLPAGSYLAIAVIAGSISPVQLNSISTRLAETQAAVNTNDATQIDSLTRERLLGDMFQLGLLSYYGQYSVLSYLSGLKQGGYHSLAAGLGSFGYEPNVDTVFGIPRSIKPGSAVMNMPIVNVTGSDSDDDGSRKAAYTTQLGAISSMLEYAVPEQLFTSSTSPGQAISAVKALTLASSAGQRVYQITQANQAAVLPLIQHNAATMAEINAALAAGETVITHTGSVSVNGWTGAGYVILDPETGAGAWKIAGGANGGQIKADQSSLWLTLLVAPLLAALSILAIPAGVAAVVLGLAVLARAIAVVGFVLSQLAAQAGFDKATLAIMRLGVTTALVFALLFAAPAVAVAPFVLTLFMMWMIAIMATELAIALFTANEPAPWSRNARFAYG